MCTDFAGKNFVPEMSQQYSPTLAANAILIPIQLMRPCSRASKRRYLMSLQFKPGSGDELRTLECAGSQISFCWVKDEASLVSVVAPTTSKTRRVIGAAILGERKENTVA